MAVAELSDALIGRRSSRRDKINLFEMSPFEVLNILQGLDNRTTPLWIFRPQSVHAQKSGQGIGTPGPAVILPVTATSGPERRDLCRKRTPTPSVRRVLGADSPPFPLLSRLLHSLFSARIAAISFCP